MSKVKTALVLKRKVNESISIGGDVEVTIKDVKGKTVKLLIVAPADVRIQREKNIKYNQTEEGDE